MPSLLIGIVHRDYVSAGWSLVGRLLKGGQGIVLDVKSKFDRAARPEGIELWRL